MDEPVTLAELVDALPEREREVINALYWERLSAHEVARRMGISDDTVARLAATARARLGRVWEMLNAG